MEAYFCRGYYLPLEVDVKLRPIDVVAGKKQLVVSRLVSPVHETQNPHEEVGSFTFFFCVAKLVPAFSADLKKYLSK